MHFETSLTVNVPRAKAYAAFIDFESMPKWSRQVTVVSIVSRDGDMVYLEAQTGSGETMRKATRAMRLFPDSRVESEGEARFTRTRRAVLFEDDDSRTKVTATLDVSVKGPWRLLLAPPDNETAEASVAEELASFAKYVEGLPP